VNVKRKIQKKVLDKKPCSCYMVAMKNNHIERFLMASYLYYILYEETPMTDYEFDMLCSEMLSKWDNIQHRYKYLVTPEMLICGTGHNLRKEDYPEEIIAMANNFLDKKRKL